MYSNKDIYAIYAGVVVDPGLYDGGNGNYVTIKHTTEDGKIFYSIYAHMQDKTKLNERDIVYAGQKLGVMGNTGASHIDHLHLGIYSYGNFIENTSWYSQNGYLGNIFNGNEVKSIMNVNGHIFYDPYTFLYDPSRFLK